MTTRRDYKGNYGVPLQYDDSHPLSFPPRPARPTVYGVLITVTQPEWVPIWLAAAIIVVAGAALAFGG